MAEEIAEEAKEEAVKPGLGKRIFKWTLRTFLVLFAVLLVAVATNPLWLGPVASRTARSLVPKYTGCEFTLDGISANLYTGKVSLRECHLKNPKGYMADEAFSVKSLDVDVGICSLFSDEIHIESIVICGLKVSYLVDGDGINNFDRMVAVATGRKPGEKDDKKDEEDEEKEGGKKVVIDHFELRDSEITYQLVRGTPPITIALPSFTLNDIGKSGDGSGLTFKKALNIICQAILKAGGAIGKAAGMAVDAAGQVVDATVEAAGAVANAAVEKASEAADAAVGGITNAVEAGGKVLDKTVGVVGDAVGSAVEAGGSILGKTVGAAGNVVGGAVEAGGSVLGKTVGAAGNAVKSVGGIFKGKDKEEEKK